MVSLILKLMAFWSFNTQTLAISRWYTDSHKVFGSGQTLPQYDRFEIWLAICMAFSLGYHKVLFITKLLNTDIL